MMLIFVALSLAVMASAQKQFDPCTNYTELFDEHGLSSAGAKAEGKLICHRRIVQTWYRFVSPAGTDMPTSCVERFHCRTRFPVWLADELPHPDGQIHDLQAQINPNRPCSQIPKNNNNKIAIKVKNCGAYNVYFLRRTPLCPAAYCFGRETRCPEGTGSVNGFTPGCKGTPISFNASLEVIAKPVMVEANHEIQFECVMSDVVIGTNSSSVIFDVEWYITKSGRDERVHMDTTDGPLVVSQSVLITNYKGLNVNISCNVRAKVKGNGGPSPWIRSKMLFIGAKYVPKNILVFPHVGGSAKVAIELTVPFVCNDKEFQCYLEFEIVITDGYKKICKNKPAILGIPQMQCKTSVPGIKIGGAVTKQQASFQVHANAIDVLTRKSYTMNMYLKTQSMNFDHAIWTNYQMPPLTVTVVDTLNVKNINLQAAHCFANNDPHMRTFDGCLYENQLLGEFIMYKHKILPYQVNIFTKRCYEQRSIKVYCTQGVAILSGRTHYIWDKIGGGPARDTYLDCDENDLRFNIHGNTRTVTFKTGTKVEINGIDREYVNVRVIPSLHDIGQTEGLCQLFDGKIEKELIGKNGVKTNCPSRPKRYNMNPGLEAFGTSWRVSGQDSLYNGNTQRGFPPISTHPGIGLCDCACNSTDECSKAVCDNSKWTTVCNPVGDDENKVYQEQCRRIMFKRRKKRAVGELDDDYSSTIREAFSMEEPDENDLLPPAAHPLWNYTQALHVCEQEILYKKAGKRCIKLNNVEYKEAVASCVQDILTTDSTGWIGDSKDSMKADCENEAIRNFSRWQHVDGSEEKVPPPEILDSICPGDCSNHGSCVSGKCQCEDDYGGEDCLIKMSAPLDINLRGRNTSLCNRSRRKCLKTPVNGLMFANTANLTCRVHIEILLEFQRDGTSQTVEAQTYRAEYLHREEIMCPLQRPEVAPRDTLIVYAYVYYITVSNDANIFGNSLTIISAHECLKCNSRRCETKDGWCFIENNCYENGMKNPGDGRFRCQANLDQNRWTAIP